MLSAQIYAFKRGQRFFIPPLFVESHFNLIIDADSDYISSVENKDLYNQIIFNNNSIIDTLTTMPIDFTILIKVKDEENQQDLSIFHDSKAQEYVGQHFYYLDNDTLKTSELIDFKIEERYTELYCPVSTYHLNYFVDNYLSMPGGIKGCFNIFDYDDNLQYNQEAMANDISTYGLMSYDECKEYIPEEVFNSLPMKYMKVAIGKELLSFEQLKYYMTHFYSLMS